MAKAMVFPRYCSKDCEPNDFRVAHDHIGKDRSWVHCTICNKKVKIEGLHQHMTDKHGTPAAGKLKPEAPKSLRDYFAGQALANLNLQAHVANPAAEALAKSAYAIADAMLEARKS
jgi:hypothetical protein